MDLVLSDFLMRMSGVGSVLAALTNMFVLDILSAGGARWFETLPFVIGFIFALIEIVVHRWKHGSLKVDVPAVAYMMSEGITLCILPIYGFCLAFNHNLASEIAAKNGKILAIGMFVAFLTLLMSVLDHWRSPASDRDI